MHSVSQWSRMRLRGQRGGWRGRRKVENWREQGMLPLEVVSLTLQLNGIRQPLRAPLGTLHCTPTGLRCVCMCVWLYGDVVHFATLTVSMLWPTIKTIVANLYSKWHFMCSVQSRLIAICPSTKGPSMTATKRWRWTPCLEGVWCTYVCACVYVLYVPHWWCYVALTRMLLADWTKITEGVYP